MITPTSDGVRTRLLTYVSLVVVSVCAMGCGPSEETDAQGTPQATPLRGLPPLLFSPPLAKGLILISADGVADAYHNDPGLFVHLKELEDRGSLIAPPPASSRDILTTLAGDAETTARVGSLWSRAQRGFPKRCFAFPKRLLFETDPTNFLVPVEERWQTKGHWRNAFTKTDQEHFLALFSLFDASPWRVVLLELQSLAHDANSPTRDAPSRRLSDRGHRLHALDLALEETFLRAGSEALVVLVLGSSTKPVILFSSPSGNGRAAQSIDQLQVALAAHLGIPPPPEDDPLRPLGPLGWNEVEKRAFSRARTIISSSAQTWDAPPVAPIPPSKENRGGR